MTDNTLHSLRTTTEALQLVADMCDAIEQLLPNNTDCDTARAVCRGAHALAISAVNRAAALAPALVDTAEAHHA